MKIETVSAIFGVREKPEHEHFNLSVFKTNVPVSELPIHMGVNGEDSIRDITVDGEIETTRKEEHERLARVYRNEILKQIYPNPMTPMPLRLADIDVDPSYLARKRPADAKPAGDAFAAGKTVNVAAEKDRIKARLDELDFKLPFGNFGIEKLRGFLAEAEAKAA